MRSMTRLGLIGSVLLATSVADAATINRALDRLADLILVAAQKALAVADGLVLARQPPVDDLLKHGTFFRSSCAP